MRDRGIGSLALAALAGVTLSCSPDRPPNVVLVTLDGLRQDHLSLSGYPRRTSSSIDQLARQGLYFPSLVPSSCSTKTSLTSLLTALDYSTHGIIEHDETLPPSFATLAERFRAAGYATLGVVASPHLSAALGYDRGFDVYDDFRKSRMHYVAAGSLAAPAMAWIATRAADAPPFFTYLHFEEPHPPWVHDPPWPDAGVATEVRFFGRGCAYVPTRREVDELDAGERHALIARYDAAILAADHEIGRLVELLRQRGELERTVIAVSSDHGFELLDRSTASHGFSPFDEVTRTFVVLFDGRRRGGWSSPATARQGRIFDIGPTLLALAGLPGFAAADGVDLLAEPSRLPAVGFTTCYGAEVARAGRWKLIDFDFAASETWFPDHRRPFDWRDGARLFDLETDPGERSDAGSVHAAERERLLGLLEQRQRRITRLRSERGGVSAPERDEIELERLRALGYLN